MRCGDLPVIAALILLVIVVVSSIAVYLFTQGYVLKTRREDSERFSQVVKIEGYSTVNYKNCILFKLYVRNVGKYPVEISSAYLDSSHGTTVESYFFSSRVIYPDELGVFVAGFNLSNEKISGKYTLRIAGSSVGAISVSSETLKESSVLRVYVIDLSSVGIPGHWAEPSLIRAYFEKYAFVELINTWDKLDRLIRNSPSKAVVVNAHGELVPMPTTWSNWKEYFIEIGRNMRNRGWIWVSTKGYPFYYVYTEATSEKITGTPSERLFVFYDDTGGDPAVSGSIAIRYGEGFLQLDGYSIAMVKSSEAFAMLLYKKFFDG